MNQGIEITCPSCGAESFLRRKPLYDGFKKVGEELSCSACGFAFKSEAEVPFKACGKPRLFDGKDLPARPRVFSGEESARLCRYCAEYIVNPFTQRCALHKKSVEATDTCPDFRTAPPAETGQGEANDK